MIHSERIVLVSEQRELVDRLVHWYRNEAYHGKLSYAYTGAAGTGKTTVIKEFIRELGITHYVACAYVGKAVTVLARHGLPAQTIHSLIYNVMWAPMIDDRGEPILKSDGSPKFRVEFELKPQLPENLQLIIVDEATMVNNQLAKDIMSFGIPVVFIGDANQLPPVFGTSDAMDRPDFRLTKIMRQAENDPIVYLSQCILNNEFLRPGVYGLSEVVNTYTMGPECMRFDSIITPMNRTRDAVNLYVRKGILGINTKYPLVGDRVICRQNNWNRCIDDNVFLTNGMTGVVTDIDYSLSTEKFFNIDFQPDISQSEFHSLQMDAKFITSDYDERKAHGFSAYDKFEFGYCVTVHAMQGSQADNVLYLDNFMYDPELTKKLRYTAITRAVKSVVFAKRVIIPDVGPYNGVSPFNRKVFYPAA